MKRIESEVISTKAIIVNENDCSILKRTSVINVRFFEENSK